MLDSASNGQGDEDFVDQSAVGSETLHRVHQCLLEGEQIVWSGKPDPKIDLPWLSKVVHPLCQVTLPVFIAGTVFGFLIDNRLMVSSCLAGIMVTAFVVLGMKQIRAMPVQAEEYVLSNRRAFSNFNSNGMSIFAWIWLDPGTNISRRRCGQGRWTLCFTRKQPLDALSNRRPRGKAQPTSIVGFLNLKDTDNLMKVAQWAVADTAHAQHLAHQRSSQLSTADVMQSRSA